MQRLNGFALCTGFVLLAGCATASRPADPSSVARLDEAAAAGLQRIAQPGGDGGAAPVAHVTDIPIDKGAITMPGHPLTSVVVTQCNLIVAVYMTMPDGRLLRFDKSASIPSEQLMNMAHSATRSERVEVSCNDVGVEGYEKHDPV